MTVLVYNNGVIIGDIFVKLSELRSDRGLTQSQLAHNCTVSINTISSIERGEFFPSLALIVKLCLVLDCKFSDLVQVVDHQDKTFINL